MKLAVTDACIFIDLFDINLIETFFLLEIEVHTTHFVINELDTLQKETLNTYTTAGKLTVHNLDASHQSELHQMNLPNALSIQDKSVLFIALHLKAMVLSSDKQVRKNAGKLSLEYHGMLWVFDELVIKTHLDTITAIKLLTTLINQNLLYKNNTDFNLEAQKRINHWQKS